MFNPQSRSHRKPIMKPLTIIGVPLDLGSGRRGVDMGPSAVRVADLNGRLASLGYEVVDAGDAPVSIAETLHYGDSHSEVSNEIRRLASISRDS
jgi:arginase